MTYEAWRISYQSSEQAACAAYVECVHLRAKISDLMINVEYLGNLKKSYEELIGELQEERDILRAKVEAMEQQEPVAYLPLSSTHMLESDVIASGVVWNCRDKAASDIQLYALPGAKGEEK